MSAGFTLVEVVVALVIIELGLLGVAGTLFLSSRLLAEADATEWIVSVAEGVRDSLAAVGTPGSGSRSVARGTVSWRWDPAAGLVVEGASQSGDVLVVLRAPAAP